MTETKVVEAVAVAGNVVTREEIAKKTVEAVPEADVSVVKKKEVAETAENVGGEPQCQEREKNQKQNSLYF